MDHFPPIPPIPIMVILHEIIITERALLKILRDVALIMAGFPFHILTIVTFNDLSANPTDEAPGVHQAILEIYITVVDHRITNDTLLCAGVVAIIALVLAFLILIIFVLLVTKRLPTAVANKVRLMVTLLANLYKFLLGYIFFTMVTSFPVLLSVTFLTVHATFDLVVKLLTKIFLALLTVEVCTVVDTLVYTN